MDLTIYVSYKYAVIFDITKITAEEKRKYYFGLKRLATKTETEKYLTKKANIVKCIEIGMYNLKGKNAVFYPEFYDLLKIENENDYIFLHNLAKENNIEINQALTVLLKFYRKHKKLKNLEEKSYEKMITGLEETGNEIKKLLIKVGRNFNEMRKSIE